MRKLISGVAAVFLCSFLCSAFALTDSAAAFGRGGFVHGLHGFYGGGIYPYSLLGGYYPRYYPYSFYEDDGPDCDFVWVKRTVKHKIAQRGIWRCS
jgi:hypothetical protein